MRSALVVGWIIACILFFSPEKSRAEKEMHHSSPGGSNAQPIPFKRDFSSSQDSLSRVVFVFVLIVVVGTGVAFFVYRKLNKKGSMLGGGNHRISVTEIKKISPKLTLFLIVVDDIDYILAQNGDQVEIVRHLNRSGTV